MNMKDPLCAAMVLAAVCSLSLRADELESLIQLAYDHNPTLRAAQAGTRQAVAAREASDEFLDPAMTATAGRMSGSATAPLLGAPVGLPATDAYGASAAVEVPFKPGVYAGVGVSEQYRVNPSVGLDSGYQTLVGAQVRIPLLQDRGFALWKQKLSRLAELKTAAEAHQQETRQTIRHAVEQSYIAYLEQVANTATSIAATERALQLLVDAEELVRLKVVPEYQLAPARLELALRREEFCASLQAIDTARLRLIQVLGITPATLLTTNSLALTDRVANLTLPPIPAATHSFSSRGAIREIEALAAAAVAETRSLDDQLRPELGLSLSGVWATDDSSALSSDGKSSAAAVLVWTRPWSQTGPRARLRESQARETQLVEVLRELQNRLTADLAAAQRDFIGAGERLKEITIAVEQASRTLEAEAERFQLGEGRSRNVLDAQNDLTKAYRSRNAVVAALLKGHSDFMYASGYQTDNNAPAAAPPAGGNPSGHQ